MSQESAVAKETPRIPQQKKSYRILVPILHPPPKKKDTDRISTGSQNSD